jgi:hypothetical protein
MSFLIGANTAFAEKSRAMGPIIQGSDAEWAAKWAPMLRASGRPAGGLVATAFVLPEKPELRIPIFAVVSLVNENDRDVAINAGLVVTTVYAKDEFGHPVPLTDNVRPFGVPGVGRSATYPDFVLPPGCAIAMPFELTNYLNFPKEGKYTVLVEVGGAHGFGCVVPPPLTLMIGKDSSPADRKESPPSRKTDGMDSRLFFLSHRDPSGKISQAILDRIFRRTVGRTLEAFFCTVDNTRANLAVTFRDLPQETIFQMLGGPRPLPLDCGGRRVGARASDYHLTIRDRSGRELPMNDSGKKWLDSHFVAPLRTDLPSRHFDAFLSGFSDGFVFPLDRMYDLWPGADYTAQVAVRGAVPGENDLKALPVRFSGPRPIRPGIDRPTYGSDRFWHRLAPLAGKGKAAELTNVVDPSALYSPWLRHVQLAGFAQYASPELHFGLWNHSDRSVAVYDREAFIPGRREVTRGADTVLLCDDNGDVVAANENRKSAYSYRELDHYSFPISKQDGTRRVMRYPLGLLFPLRPGRRYTALMAIDVGGDVGSLLVAKPVTFTVPSEEKGAETTLAWQRPSALPLTFEQQWEELLRFAGKVFEGLQLDAKLAPAAAGTAGPLRLAVALRNRADQTVVVKKWRGDSDFEFLIRDPAGKPLPPNEKGKKFFDSATRLDVRELKPGEAIEATLPLSEFFDFKARGDYTALVSLPVLGDVDAVLTAAPINIHVP